MMKRIERFEDLVAWQKARSLARSVYEVTTHGTFIKDFSLSAQIQRAAVSIMSNVAEGFERSRPAEFHQFLSVAKGSCAEVRSHLYVALDAGHLNQKKFAELLAQAEEVGRIIGLRASLKSRTKPVSSSSSNSQDAVSSAHAPAFTTQHSALRTQH
ncbi:four helix bundle protein [Candidatus Nitrospira bockiana]